MSPGRSFWSKKSSLLHCDFRIERRLAGPESSKARCLTLHRGFASCSAPATLPFWSKRSSLLAWFRGRQAGHIPQAHVVAPARRQGLAVRRERQRLAGTDPGHDFGADFAGGRVPETDRTVLARRGHGLPIRGEGE